MIELTCVKIEGQWYVALFPSGAAIAGPFDNLQVASAARDALLSDGSTPAPTQPAGGDLSGSYPDPLVSKVGGKNASDVTAAVDEVASATADVVPGTLMERDSNGDVHVNVLRGDVEGNVTGNAGNVLRTWLGF